MQEGRGNISLVHITVLVLTFLSLEGDGDP
jgi:hypothetical protein